MIYITNMQKKKQPELANLRFNSVSYKFVEVGAKCIKFNEFTKKMFFSKIKIKNLKVIFYLMRFFFY